jgi:hypothetical protein
MNTARPPSDEPESSAPDVPSGGSFPPQSFSDPPEENDATIHPRLGVYYRLSLTGHKLSELVAIVPEIPDLAVAMQNTSTGCWAAFTSTRTSVRIAAQVHLPNVMEIVDQTGRRLCFK